MCIHSLLERCQREAQEQFMHAMHQPDATTTWDVPQHVCASRLSNLLQFPAFLRMQEHAQGPRHLAQRSVRLQVACNVAIGCHFGLKQLCIPDQRLNTPLPCASGETCCAERSAWHNAVRVHPCSRPFPRRRPVHIQWAGVLELGGYLEACVLKAVQWVVVWQEQPYAERGG